MNELRAELHSPKKEVLQDAVKKVIAAMTVGKDVSVLFPDVINCMQTEVLELKKLVYLYLINYAKSNPEMTLMAVNTFVRDTSHSSPLIRALAVRTMGCIRVERITEYLCKPLMRCLNDEDPYVRKTAAMCVAKLYDISPGLVRDQGFLDKLRDLITDSNPTVVANAVAALSEVQEASGRAVMELTTTVLQKLLAALNECTEWGQVFILDFLARYTPSEEREAESIVERVLPRLAHQNAAVVLSAVKIVMRYMELMTNEETVKGFERKLSPPLVTLSQSSAPEIQYVALRNIALVVQKRPGLLAHKIRVFYCKYNDPIYVKMEKLDVLVGLTNERNIDPVLAELKEYAMEVDVDFVRKAVRTIGRCAIKLERAAERCIKVLLQLIQTKVNYVVQEAVVVIKDIFRKYPNRYESVIGVLCDALESLDDPDAKASMVWILGEYAGRIENAGELIDSFLDSFEDEPASVQLQLLTATVKLFLTKPGETQPMVQKVLNLATEMSDNPDLRDRGYVYWRLLSQNPEAARSVVLAERPVIQDDSSMMDAGMLNLLISNISTLASVYHKPPEAFVVRETKEGGDDVDDISSSDESEASDDEGGADGADGAAGGAGGSAPAPGAAAATPAVAPEDDLLGVGDLLGATPAPAAAAPASSGLDDLFGGGGGTATPAPAAGPSVPTGPPLADANGLQIWGRLIRRAGKIAFSMTLKNAQSTPVSTLAVRFNVNTFGLQPGDGNVAATSPIAPGGVGQAEASVVLSSGHVKPGPPTLTVDVAMRDNTSGAVLKFSLPIDFEVLFVEDGEVEQSVFISNWQSIPEENELEATITGIVDKNLADPTHGLASVQSRLSSNNVFYVAQRRLDDGQIKMYCSLKTYSGLAVMCEFTFKNGYDLCKLCLKSERPAAGPFIRDAITNVLKRGFTPKS